MDTAHAQAICAAIMEAQREAAQLMLHAHGAMAQCKTGRRDVVTEYDRKIQALLTERLSAAVPGAKFYCEESEERDDLDAEHLFIIDPIDATMNFVHGLNYSCISVAYTHRGELWAGAVYNPYADEMFHAVRGAGAFCNGRPLHVDPSPLAESLVLVGTSPYRQDLLPETFRLAEIACREGLDIRRQGSAALDLCSIAAGRAGLYFELNLSLWDYAAGALLVWEAGGLCTAVDGGPLPFDGSKPSVMAGNQQAMAAFRAAAELR